MLFHVYGENALPQWIAMLGVLAALILLNEVARRTKAGGILMFFVIPAILTVYFIAIAVGAKTGASWALNNQTYLYMNGWFHYAKLYAALAGCIGFMMIKYEWGIGKAHWFKAYPFAIVAINILIAVASDFESAINGWYSWWLSSEDVWLYGGWHNVFNGIAGIINILCMTGWWAVYTSKDKKDMIWPDMIWVYILVYEFRLYLQLSADTFLVLRRCTSACTDNRSTALEQRRLDHEPCQHALYLVYVRAGIPSVPGDIL